MLLSLLLGNVYDDSIDDKEDDFQIIKTTVFFLLIEDLLIER